MVKLDPLEDLKRNLDEQFKLINTPDYEPTGTQEDIITTVGCGKFDIVVVLSCNKFAGKTGTAVNVLKNILWENDKEWFNHPLYNEWPYKHDDGKPIQKGRITGTVKNTADDGPIREEILKWWPKNRYNAWKNSKSYHSLYSTDSGWTFDVLTYEQNPDEYEGPLLSWTWSDEPPKPQLVGAITSRFMHGGLWLITATPIKCAAFLDVLDDIADKGGKIKTISTNVWDNSIEDGKPNHKGRKKGIAHKDEIDAWVSMQPRDEIGPRVEGKAVAKQGKIYPDFDATYHVRDFDNFPDSDYVRRWNCYCGMDPHRKHYPFLGWWALTPDEIWVCYNEWPTYRTLGAFYDEVRHTAICNHAPEKISNIIKAMDMTEYGLSMCGRYIDRRFAKGTEADWSKKSDGIIEEYALHDVCFALPPAERIDTQREHIRELLKFNRIAAVTADNRPSVYIMPHCVNTRRAFERHYWEEGSEREAERYKDPIDVFRYILAGVGSDSYYEVRAKTDYKKKDPKQTRVISQYDMYCGDMMDISMV